MENIDPTVPTLPASKDIRDKKVPQDTLVIKPNIGKITNNRDADELRAKTDESRRVDAAKNLEMVRERLKEISASLNEDMEIRSKNLKFSVDKITNRILVTVSDKKTGKVIRQIPSEAILKVAHNLEALKGIMYDDKY